MDEREQHERQEVPPEVWEEPREGASRPQQPQAQGLNYYIREEPAMPRREGEAGPPVNQAYGPPQGAPYGPPPNYQNQYGGSPPYNAQPPYQAGPYGQGYYGQNGGPPPAQNPNPVPPAYNAVPPAYHAPNAQQPYQYGPQAYQPPQNGANNGGQTTQEDIKRKNCARLSLIFGIIAFLSSLIAFIPALRWISWFSFPLAIAAIPLGVYGKAGRRPGYGMGIAGMTLGIVYLAISLIIGILAVLIMFGLIAGLIMHA